MYKQRYSLRFYLANPMPSIYPHQLPPPDYFERHP